MEARREMGNGIWVQQGFQGVLQVFVLATEILHNLLYTLPYTTSMKT
jgi:hypothetical protein